MSPGTAGNTLLSMLTAQIGKWDHRGVGIGEQRQKTFLCISLYLKRVSTRDLFLSRDGARMDQHAQLLCVSGWGNVPFQVLLSLMGCFDAAEKH